MLDKALVILHTGIEGPYTQIIKLTLLPTYIIKKIWTFENKSRTKFIKIIIKCEYSQVQNNQVSFRLD